MLTDAAKKLVEKLQKLRKTMSIMESCTGGGLSNEITNICGASEVFNFCAVTYSNDYKIRMGVSANVIDKYSVYSMETAREMSIAISKFTGSDYGIGITGKLNCIDLNNHEGQNDVVYTSIYNRASNEFNSSKIRVESEDRIKNKERVMRSVIGELYSLLKRY